MHALIDIDILSSLTVESINVEIDALERQVNILHAIRDVLLREEERSRPPAIPEEMRQRLEMAPVAYSPQQPIQANAPTKNTTAGRFSLDLRRRQVLGYLLKHGPTKCQDLAKALSISSAYLSCLVKHEWFYLERLRDKLGRRYTPYKAVHLTDLGSRQKGEANGNG